MMKRASAKPRTEEKELELIIGGKLDKKYECKNSKRILDPTWKFSSIQVFKSKWLLTDLLRV